MEQTGRKLSYRRLQVRNVWPRTIFEIVAIIFAIIACCSIIVSSYETSFSDYSRRNTTENSLQIAHAVANIPQRGAMFAEGADAREYVAEKYTRLLGECFMSEDMLYSGAIYQVREDELKLFAESRDYSGTLSECGLISDGTPVEDFEGFLEAAAYSGSENAVYYDDSETYVSFVPVVDDETGVNFAVVVTSAKYRSSAEYPSLVRKRLVMIAILCGVLLLVYYCVSALRSEKKTRENSELMLDEMLLRESEDEGGSRYSGQTGGSLAVFDEDAGKTIREAK